MRAHVTATVRACFAILRQISSIRHSLSRPALLTLLRALVISCPAEPLAVGVECRRPAGFLSKEV